MWRRRSTTLSPWPMGPRSFSFRSGFTHQHRLLRNTLTNSVSVMIHMSGVALSSNHDAMLITPKEFRGSILNMTPTSRIQTSYAYIIQRRLERVARFTHPFRGDPAIDSVLAMGLPNPTDRYLAEHPVIPRHPRKFRRSGWNPLPFPRLAFQPTGWSQSSRYPCVDTRDP